LIVGLRGIVFVGEAAALQFLAENGCPSCRVVDAYLLARPQWEVKYDCPPRR